MDTLLCATQKAILGHPDGSGDVDPLCASCAGTPRHSLCLVGDRSACQRPRLKTPCPSCWTRIPREAAASTGARVGPQRRDGWPCHCRSCSSRHSSCSPPCSSCRISKFWCSRGVHGLWTHNKPCRYIFALLDFQSSINSMLCDSCAHLDLLSLARAAYSALVLCSFCSF